MRWLWAYLCWILNGHRHRPLWPPQEWESLPFEPDWTRYDNESRLS